MSFTEFAIRLRGWPRRVLALACLLLAVVTAIGAQHDDHSPDQGAPVLVAARDLAAGIRLSNADVQVRTWPASLRPPTAPSRPAQVLGRRLAGPVHAGEPLTTTRFVGADLSAGLPANLQAVPVQITGAALLNLVRVGDSIDLLVGDSVSAGQPTPSSPAVPGPARVLAQRVRVLAVAAPSPAVGLSSVDGIDSGTIGLIVAADRATALRIAAATDRPIVATVRSPP